MSSATVSICLANHELWEKFYPNTEMVARKGGRRMSPSLEYRVGGLEAGVLYKMEVHFERVDDKRYTYKEGKRIKKDDGEPILPICYTEHPGGVRSGEEWMSEKISFASLRITNTPNDRKPDVVFLQSMHKYQPVLTITRIEDDNVIEFRFEHTQFVAVTAYHNPEVTKLKTEHNKYAHKRNASDDSENQDPKRRRPSIPCPPFPMSSTPSTPPALCPSTSSPPSLHPHLNVEMPSALVYQPPTNYTNVYHYNYGSYNRNNQWYHQNQQYYPTVPMHAPPPHPHPPMLAKPTGMSNQLGHY